MMPVRDLWKTVITVKDIIQKPELYKRRRLFLQIK